MLALTFHNHDFAGIKNDANPATMVDYNQYWVNFESSSGGSYDSGGVDRTIRIINDGSPDYTDPNAVIVDPPVVEPPHNRSSGSISFGLLLTLIIFNIYTAFVLQKSNHFHKRAKLRDTE